MRAYVASFAAGLLVGVLYALLHVRSPAPPVIALLGLLGILIGEQVPSLVQHVAARRSTSSAWAREQVQPHVFGQLPAGRRPAPGPEEPKR